MENLFDFSPSEILRVSAKSGANVREVLDAVVERSVSGKDMHVGTTLNVTGL